MSCPGSGSEAVEGAPQHSSSGEEPRFQNHGSLSLSNSPQPNTAHRQEPQRRPRWPLEAGHQAEGPRGSDLGCSERVIGSVSVCLVLFVLLTRPLLLLPFCSQGSLAPAAAPSPSLWYSCVWHPGAYSCGPLHCSLPAPA